jgi:signal peptidase I
MNSLAGSRAGRQPGPEWLTGLLRLCAKSGIELVATIEGFSMTPVLPPGTRVRLRPVDPKYLQSGDVIAFFYQERLIAHRVVRIGRTAASRRYLLTRGDALLLNDVPVSFDSAVGVVTAKRIGIEWVSLGRAGPGGSKYWAAALFTAIAGLLLDLSPGGAVRLIRWASRGRAATAALRATLSVS